MQHPKIQVMPPKILVQVVKPMEKNKGNIIIPSTVHQPLEEAVIILVGDGQQYLKPGMRILYPRGAGIVQEFNNESYKFLNGPTSTDAGDVWAIL